MNPVLIILSIAVTAFGCVGFWTFASLFVTRKEDKKAKNVDSAVDLETASGRYRAELQADLDKQRQRFGRFATVVIRLMRTYDLLDAKIRPALSDTENAQLQSETDAVWGAIAQE